MPGLLALIEGELPSGRYRAREPRRGARRERPACALPVPSCEAHEPPEARGLGRDDVALLVATPPRRRARRTRASPSCRASSSPATSLVVNTSRDAARGAATRAPDGRRSSCASRRPRRTSTGHWVVELRTARAPPFRRPPSRRAARRFPAARRGAARAATPASAGSGVARLDLPARRSTTTSTATAEPIRYGYVPDAWPLERLPERLRPRAGKRRDAERRPAVHGRARDASSSRAGSSSHRSRCTPASRRPSAASRPYPERYRVPAETARLVNAVRALGRPRDRGRHDRRARARDRRRPDGAVRRGEGWTDLVVTPGARAARRRRPAHRLARARALAPRPARGGGRRRAARSAPTARPPTHGYRWHEFGDLHLILP